MKTRKSFLQKTIISIFVALLLINCIVPIVGPSQIYVEAKKTGETKQENYKRLKELYQQGSEDVFRGPNGEYGVRYDRGSDKAPKDRYAFRYYTQDGEEHEVNYVLDSRVTDYDLFVLTQGTLFTDSKDYKVAVQFKNRNGDDPTYATSVQAKTGDKIFIFDATEPEIDNGQSGQQVSDDENIDPHSTNTDLYQTGGILLDAIVELLCRLGDVVINVLQLCMTGDFQGFSLTNFLAFSQDWNGSASSNTEPKEEVKASDLDKGWLSNRQDYHIPKTIYSPEEIFAGQVSGLDINFINPDASKWGTTTVTRTGGRTETVVNSVSGKLQKTIASWYVALRNLTVVGLLSVLVYVAIRMIISSTAASKSKYKQMLFDWLVAVCLLFFLHYIMSFTVTMVESICSAIYNGSHTTQTQTGSVHVFVDDGKSFDTNLLGLARFKTQYKEAGTKVSYLIMYLALVVYTVIFTWFYLKRVLMMAFLTLMAPVVAFTYPIDKIGDGKAQAFDAWMKEYVFNALIQPFHLIIYMVFVGSAMDLASTNIIYTIAALGFILPAEKILRGFFGFNKAGAGTLGQIVGGAAIGSYLSKGIHALGGDSGKGGKSGKGNATVEGEKPLRFEKPTDFAGIEPGDGPDSGSASGKQEKVRSTSYDDLDDDDLPPFLKGNGAYTNDDKKSMYSFDNVDFENEDIERNVRGIAAQAQAQAQAAKELTLGDKVKNFGNYNGRRAAKGIKGALKFAGKTAFKAGVGTLAGAVAMASGGGIGGGIAAFATGATLAGKGLNAAGGFASGIDKEVRGQMDAFNGNGNMKNAAELRAKLKDETNLDYVRTKMMKENGGRIPSEKAVRNRLDTYKPYLKEGINMRDADKAQKVAKDLGISDEQVAKIVTAGRQMGIDASILNKESDREQYMENFRSQVIKSGRTEEEADRVTRRSFEVLQDFYGVTPKQANRQARAEKEAKKAERRARSRESYNNKSAQAERFRQQGGRANPVGSGNNPNGTPHTKV